jgi:hypothetical protein
MLMGEFLTAVQHKLPVKALVYDNSAFGPITLEAESLGLPAWKKAIDFPNPDYVALARACGAAGFKAEKPGELRDAIGASPAVERASARGQGRRGHPRSAACLTRTAAGAGATLWEIAGGRAAIWSRANPSRAST